MTADELYDALKEIERTSDKARRDELIQAVIKRLTEYNAIQSESAGGGT